MNDSVTSAKLAAHDAASIQAASWSQLIGARIYFGHQSVGNNILEGLRELDGVDSGSPLRIVRFPQHDNNSPALVEFTIGENGRPESKVKDFAAVLEQIDDGTEAIAIFKYCYLDITPETDIEQLFANHRKAVDEMRAQHPNLIFVHVTSPLTRLESGPRYLAKRLLGKPTTRDTNAKRNRFNAMLRAQYAGDPIFDLAKVESTRADGSRSFFKARGEVVYTLAPELTDDGGHLNARGRKAAAHELASVVGSVAAQQLAAHRVTP